MENFKTVAQTHLGETAHFDFCLFPKSGFFGGPGRVPEILFSLESSYFCYLGAPVKFQNCNTNPSGRNGQFWLLNTQNRLFQGGRGGPQIFFFIGFVIFLLLRSPCKISKLQHKPFWEIQPILAFVRPKSVFLGGQGGSPKCFFHWNLHIFVTQEPMQKFKILQQSLLG